MQSESQTFGAILDKHRGVGPGFDLLRILLAVAILYGHAKWAAGTDPTGPALTALATHGDPTLPGSSGP